MSQSVSKQIDTEIGPPEHSPEGQLISKTAGFPYRHLLGVLIYAYVVCRVDIGFALTKLSQYSHSPGAIHFAALQSISVPPSLGVLDRKSVV